MNVAGPTPLTFAGAESPGTSNPVDPGAYKVTESGGPAGYALSYSGDCDADGDVSVGVGQTKTCTLTNDDAGGDRSSSSSTSSTTTAAMLVASAWQMNVAGPTNLSFAGAEAPGVSDPVERGRLQGDRVGRACGLRAQLLGRLRR